MQETSQNIDEMQAANDNSAPKGELDKFFEAEVQKPSVTNQLRTSVSKLAIIAPSIFMSHSDAGKMVKMLGEEREEVFDVLEKAA